MGEILHPTPQVSCNKIQRSVESAFSIHVLPVLPLLRHVDGIGIYRAVYLLPLERNKTATLNTWLIEGIQWVHLGRPQRTAHELSSVTPLFIPKYQYSVQISSHLGLGGTQ